MKLFVPPPLYTFFTMAQMMTPMTAKTATVLPTHIPIICGGVSPAFGSGWLVVPSTASSVLRSVFGFDSRAVAHLSTLAVHAFCCMQPRHASDTLVPRHEPEPWFALGALTQLVAHDSP